MEYIDDDEDSDDEEDYEEIERPRRGARTQPVSVMDFWLRKPGRKGVLLAGFAR